MTTGRLKLAVASAALLLLLAACFGPVDPADPGVLELGTFSPLADATDVPIDAVLSATAGADLDPATVTLTSVRLLQGTTEIPASLDVSGNTVTLTPESLLNFGTTYTVAVSGSVASLEGATLAGDVEWSFTTRPFTVNVVTSGGDPVSGASVTGGTDFSGTTDSSGSIDFAGSPGGDTAFSAEKSFFLPAEDNVPLDGSLYELELALAPYVYVAGLGDGDSTFPRIVEMTAIDQAFTSWQTVNAVDYIDPDTGTAVSYTLTGPRAMHVDYENGLMYVADAATVNDVVNLIRLSAFPPASDGTEAEVVQLSQSPSVGVYGTQQLTVLDDGSIVVLDYRGDGHDATTDDQRSRLVQIPADLDMTAATFGPWFTGDDDYFYGISQLGSELLVTGGTAFAVISGTLDSVSDDTLSGFSTLTDGSGDN